MFGNTRKKKVRNRVIATVLGVFVLAFGIWLNFNDRAEKAPAENTVQKVKIDEADRSDREEKRESKEKNTEETDTRQAEKTYLIEEVDGVVKVFICDEKEKKELYLITSIPFELLSENDQKLFRDGVYLDTEEDLGKFLENFDS